ncbi:MAG: hypothetical protein ACXWNW_13710 [Isosphaeraceae bacterium]
MTELLGVIAVFVGLMMIGKITIMGLDDRSSRMLRPIPIQNERSKR